MLSYPIKCCHNINWKNRICVQSPCFFTFYFLFFKVTVTFRKASGGDLKVEVWHEVFQGTSSISASLKLSSFFLEHSRWRGWCRNCQAALPIIHCGQFQTSCASVKMEQDENVPPAGDTVGRRLPRRNVKNVSSSTSWLSSLLCWQHRCTYFKAMSVPSQPSSRTPLRMKIKICEDTAKVCSTTVR